MAHNKFRVEFDFTLKDYFDAVQCAAENEGVIYFFFGEPPKEIL